MSPSFFLRPTTREAPESGRPSAEDMMLSSLDMDMSLLPRTLQARTSQKMACHPLLGASDDDVDTTDVSVTYEMTTVGGSRALDDDVALAALPALVQGAAVEAVHGRLCAAAADTATGRKPNTVARLAACIFSITAAEEGGSLGYCDSAAATTATATAEDCVAFRGTLKIFHTEECRAEIALAARLALEEGATEAAFLESINSRLVAADYETPLSVTQVTVVEDYEPAQQQDKGGVVVAGIATEGNGAAIAEDKGLTPGAIVMIALGAMVMAVLLLLLFLRRRSQRQLRNRSLDEKSVVTDSDRSFGSYRTNDFANLAQANSKMDVHACASALCPVCSSNPDGVHMVTVPPNDGGFTPQQIYQEYEAREESFEAIRQEEPPAEIATTLKRSPLRRFGVRHFNSNSHTKPPTSTTVIDTESVSFVRNATALSAYPPSVATGQAVVL
jgi:hypothetical protein